MRRIEAPRLFNGAAGYIPADPDEAAIAAHANLVAWMSGASVVLREADTLWPDAVAPEICYYTPGGPGVGAQAAADASGQAGVRIRDNQRGSLRGNVQIPASYTLFALFSADVAAAGTQTIVGDRNTNYPRAQLFLHPTGQVRLGHTAADAISHSSGTAMPGVPAVGWGSYDASSRAAAVGKDSHVPTATGTLTQGHAGGADLMIGAVGQGLARLTGGFVTDVLVFNAALGEADRRLVVDYLMRKAGLR